MKTLFVSMILSLFVLNGIYAQTDHCERWTVGANFTFTQPIGAMQENGFRSTYGLTLNGFYNLTPEQQGFQLHVGAKFTAGLTWAERDQITLVDPEGAAARSAIYNALIDIAPGARLLFGPGKKVQSYLDLYGGARLTAAHQGIRLKRRTPGYDRRTSEQLTQSGNWTWGFGTGILIHLQETTYLDIGMNYMKSNQNRFVDLDSYSEVNDIIDYNIVNSVSNSVGFHIGFHTVIQCGGYDTYDNNTDDRDFERRRLRTFKKKPRAKTKTKTSSSKN